MIYHVLPEAESFSEFRGGAISRWAANVLQHDSSHMICSFADDSWGFAKERIHLVPNVRRYLRFRARKHYPPQMSGPLLRYFFGDDLPPFQQNDVVWVHGVPAVADALLPLVKRVGAKLVFHLHSSAFVQDSQFTLQRIRNSADLIVFCSHFLRTEALQRFPNLPQATILYNGADAHIFQPPLSRAREGPPTILFAARLVPEKGLHVLLAAMRLLEQRGVEAKLKVFGASAFGGSASTKYSRSLQEGLPGNVEFCGYLSGPELARQFQIADVFCLPATYEEPLAMALIEAIACGLPVVASRVGGIPEVIRPGVGILVPPANAEVLADALSKVVRDRSARVRMGELGIAAFKERFTWDCVRSRYHTLVDAVMNGSKPEAERERSDETPGE